MILDNYQKDLISEAMVLWLLFCGLTCNEKWICYKKTLFSYISTFCQKLLFLLLQIVSANYSEMPFFNLGQVTRQPQINCSCYSNKAAKYFLINHELICWTLLHFFESHWCIFPLHFGELILSKYCPFKVAFIYDLFLRSAHFCVNFDVNHLK